MVGEVPESVGEASDPLDAAVDGFGAAVGRACDVEVGPDLGSLPPQCSAKPHDVGNCAGVQGVEHLLGGLAAVPAGGRALIYAALTMWKKSNGQFNTTWPFTSAKPKTSPSSVITCSLGKSYA